MAAKTAAECKAFVQATNVGATVKVTWRYANANVNQPPWTGEVISKVGAAGSETHLKIRYAGKGDALFDFPPDADIAIVAMSVEVAAVAPSMAAIERLTTTHAVQELDMSTWGPYMRDVTGIGLLIDKFRQRFNVPSVASIKELQELRRNHYFEKQTLLDVLEGWAIDKVGTTSFTVPPASNVPTLVIRRLYAFELQETEGGNVAAYMAKARASGVPKDLQELRKAALAQSSKNDQDE